MKEAIAVVAVLMFAAVISAVGVFSEAVETDGGWNRTYGVGWSQCVISLDDGYLMGGSGKVVKVDMSGDMIWETSLNATVNSALEVSDGYILAGYAGPPGTRVVFWLGKMDNEGSLKWSHIYGYYGTGNPYIESAKSVVQTRDGGYLLAGNTGENYAWVVKTDAHGNELWNRTYGGGEEDARAILRGNDGGYVVAGYTGTYGTDDWDAWLLKIDEQGNEVWNTTWSGGGTTDARGLIATGDGYVAVGDTMVNGYSAFLLKANNTGDIVWSNIYTASIWDSGEAVAAADSGYALVGDTEAGLGMDGWLVRVDEQGKELWSKTYGERDADIAEAVFYQDGNFIIAGRKGQSNPQSWLIKIPDEAPDVEIEITRPRQGYLYLFDREIMPVEQTVAIGGLTVVAEVLGEAASVRDVRFYLSGGFGDIYDVEPRAVDDRAPYQWTWRSTAMGLVKPYTITAAAFYGGDQANQASRVTVHMVKMSPFAVSRRSASTNIVRR